MCTNGIKFSVILFPSQYSQIIDTWSDILTGCLSLSALTAIHHFISADYDDYLLCVKKIVEHNKQAVLKILKKYKIQYDTLSNSYLLSIYFLNLPYNYFDEKTNIIKFIDSTAAYVIPNSSCLLYTSSVPNCTIMRDISISRLKTGFTASIKKALRHR